MKALWRMLRRKGVPDGLPPERAVGSTPVIRYVNLVLYGVFVDGVGTRVLRQSEPLLPLTVHGEELQPPPFAAVVNRLKVMSGLDPVTYRTPAEGIIRLTIEGVECRALCRFDDAADDRCHIRMERQGSGHRSADA